jgi:hypothetical protein
MLNNATKPTPISDVDALSKRILTDSILGGNIPFEHSAPDWPVSPLTQLVEVWLMKIDQFIHLLQTVVCCCHDVDPFQWDVVMVPVSPTVHPDREGYHHDAHDAVTQNTSTEFDVFLTVQLVLITNLMHNSFIL